MRWMIIPLIALMLTACGGASTEQQTLEAIATTQTSNLAALAATATVNAERLEITLEGVNTQFARVQRQRIDMVSTLEARGITVNSLPGVTIPPFTNTPTPFGLAPSTPTPTANALPTFQPTVPTEASFRNPLGLSNIVTAPSVQEDDCATTVQSTFTPETVEIYVVATATGFINGTTVETSWARDGQTLTTFDFSYGEIDRACIWFFADQTDFEFLPGNYIITLSVNDTIAGQVNFSIDDMNDG